jgi:hypothetical protein
LNLKTHPTDASSVSMPLARPRTGLIRSAAQAIRYRLGPRWVCPTATRETEVSKRLDITDAAACRIYTQRPWTARRRAARRVAGEGRPPATA